MEPLLVLLLLLPPLPTAQSPPALAPAASPTPPPPPAPLVLNKCCWRGQYWDLTVGDCMSYAWASPDFTVSEALEPPITASWVPPALRNRSILARYDGELRGNEMAVLDAGNATLMAEAERVNASAGVFAAEERFQPPVDERAVYEQHFCVDHTNDGRMRHVLITGLITRHLNKCCPDGQRLTRRADACEDVAGEGGSGEDGSGEDGSGSGMGEVGVSGSGGDGMGEDGSGVEEVGVSGSGEEGLSEGEGGLEGVGVRRKRGLTDGNGGSEVEEVDVNESGGGVSESEGANGMEEMSTSGSEVDENESGGQELGGVEEVGVTESEGEGLGEGGSGFEEEGVSGSGSGAEEAGWEAWRPPSPLARMPGVRWGAVGVQPWNVAVRAVPGSGAWRLEAPRGQADFRVWVRGPRGGPEGETDAYCFDAVGSGPLAPRALLAAVVHARKCCGRGQRLSGDAQRCEGAAGAGPPVGAEARDAAWLPAALRNASRAVGFAAQWGLATALLVDADDAAAWGVERGAVRVAGLAPAAVGRWCVDARAGGERVLAVEVACGAKGVRCVPKCCPAGRLLLADGQCGVEATPTADWDPMRSPAASLLVAGAGQGVARLVARFMDSCPWLTLAPPLAPAEVARRLLLHEEKGRVSNVYHCADRLLGGGEALATCELPPLASLYAGVRPLQLLAVLLLALGIVSLLAQRDTRRTMHGWALAAHAAALLAANALQSVWFFTFEREQNCNNIAYAIYFFLVASGVWLNVVSINMARGFRQPLGARAARGGGGQSRALVRQVAAWSAYGWGAPALLTALAVSMFLNRELLEAKGVVAPTFVETRTCLSEDKLFFKGTGYRNWGAMYYYYIPMTLLVVVNGACLAFTTFTIRKMKKETAMVQKIGSSTSASGALQNARLYVKLLLTAGVTEIVLEVTVWAVRPHSWDEANFLQIFSSTMKLTFIFHMVATLVDVARALAVLWLSAGRWEWPGQAAKAARLALRAVRARAARAARGDAQPGPAHAPDTPTDAASVDTSTTGC